MSRPSWDEYFLQIATLVSSRSTCLRRKVGAVIVKDKRILTTGYNGVPRGLAHCVEVGCLREKWESHPVKIRSCVEDCMPNKMLSFKEHYMVSVFRMVSVLY